MKALKFKLTIALVAMLFSSSIAQTNYYTNNYVTIPGTSTEMRTGGSGGLFTYEAHFYFNTVSGSQALFGKGDGGTGLNAILVDLIGNTIHVFDHSITTWVSTGLTVSANEWTYVAVQFANGGTATVYKKAESDGSVQVAGTTVNVSNGTADNSSPLYIGLQGDCACNQLNGFIDEVRVWDTGQQNTYVNIAVPVSQSNLIAYYNFNNGSSAPNLSTSASTTSPPSNLDASIFGGSLFTYNSPIFDFDGDGTFDDTDPCIADATDLCSATEPTTQATSTNITNDNQTSVDVNWIRGNGDRVIVLAAQTTSGSPSFTEGTTHPANANFASGTNVGGGWYVVYDGTGTSFTMTGLTQGTDYRVAVYEYNSTYNNYLLSEASNVINFTTAIPDGTSIATGNWSAPATWANGNVPASTDSVVIQSAHTVTLDQNIDVLSLNVEGSLTTANFDLNIENFFVADIGTVTYSGNETITMDATVAGTYSIQLSSGGIPDLVINPTASGVTYNLGSSSGLIFQTDKTITISGPGQLDLTGTTNFLTGASSGVVQSNGSLLIGPAAALNLSNGATYTQSGGSLYIQGTPGSEAYLSASTGNWSFSSTGGGVIAEHFIISGSSGNGMEFSTAAFVGPPYFSDGTFTAGTGTAYLTFNNTAMEGFTSERTVFDAGPTYSVQKLGGTGVVTFSEATGALSGDGSENEVSGTIDWVVPENALNFDGVDDYVQAADIAALDLTTAVTMEAWVKLDATPSNFIPIISKWNPDSGPPARSYALVVGDDNNLAILVSDDGSSNVALFGSIPLELGTWHHVAGSFSANELTLYVDGNLAGYSNTGVPSSLYSGTAPLTLGTYSNTAEVTSGGITEVLAMDLDEVRIWSEARSQNDLQNNMFGPLIGSESNLVAYYNFNVSTGTSLGDLTINLNDATLFNNNDNTPLADGETDGPVWTTSGAFQLTPRIYPATDVSENGFTANWLQIPNAVSAVIDIATDAGFTSTIATDIVVSDPLSNFFFVSQDLSSYVGTALYYRLRYNDGSTDSPNSSAQEFRVAPGEALPFNGSSHYVQVGDDPALNLDTEVTLSAWVRRTSLSNIDVILEKGGDWNLGEANYGMALSNINNNMFYFFFDGGWRGTSGIDDLEWHHFAAVAQEGATDPLLYIDGQLQAIEYMGGAGTITLNELTTRELHIGAQVDPSIDYFSSLVIDEVSVWNYQLAQSEIQPLQYRTLSGTELGLQAYYRFDETGGITLPDLSVNDLDGTLIGMAGTEWTTSEAMTPRIFQVTGATTAGYTVNWNSTQHGNGNVLLDVNTASDFTGTSITTGEVIGNSDSDQFSSLNALTASTRYYARIYLQDGDFQSPYSDVVDFFVEGGNALNFNGTTDYVVVADDPTFDNTIGTIEAWVRTSANDGNYRGIVVNNPQYGMWTLNGQLYTYDEGIMGPIGSGVFIADGNWHHVAFAWEDGTTSQLYVDGVPAGSSFNYNSLTSLAQVHIGANVANQVWDGDIDEVRIWDRKLTDTEILENVFTTLTGNEEGLVGYFRMDEGEASANNTGIGAPEIVNLTGNQLDGTMTGFTKNGATSNWVASGALSSSDPPTAPDSLIAYKSSDTEIALEWVDLANNEVDFLIERATDFAFSSPVTVDVVPANTDHYLFDAGANQAYYYRVTARNGNGNGVGPVKFATTGTHPGSALTFDGTDDQINVLESNNLLDLTGNATIEMWVNRTSGAGTDIQTLIDKTETGDNANFRIFINDETNALNPNSVGFWDGTTSYQSPALTITNGIWTHIAITLDGADIRFYKDGALVETLTGAFGPVNNGDLILGNESFNPAGRAFIGQMDEVRVWNVVKTDFSDRFNSLNGNETDLIAYYSFNENVTDATIIDGSVNSFNGTPTGSPTYNASGAIAPSDLQLFEISATQIDLSWTDNTTNETGFTIERSLSTDFTAPDATFNVGTDVTTFVDNTVAATTEYYYRVNAELPGAIATGFTNTEVAATYGIPGNALNFDGGSDYISVPDDPAFTFGSAFTAEAWIRTSAATVQELVSHFDNAGNTPGFTWGVGLDVNDGRLSFFAGDGATNQFLRDNAAPVVNDGFWHHVAVTYDGSTAILYVDGTPYTAAGTTINIGDATGTLNIGRSNNVSPERFFDGDMDEVRLWNIVRSGSDIADNRFSKLDPSTSGLVAYYDFDQGTPGGTNTGLDVLHDLSASGFDGQLQTFGLIGSTSNWVSSGAMTPSSSPATPTDFVAYKTSDTQIDLSWTDVATDEMGYRVEISGNYNFTSPTQIADLPAGSTSFSHNVTDGDSYFYRVTAYNGASGGISDIDFASTADFPGRSLEFDGTDDYIQITSDGSISFDQLEPFTFEAWVLARNPLSRIINKFQGGPSRGIDFAINGQKLHVNISHDGGSNDRIVISSFEDIPLNEWVHVAFTYNGSSDASGVTMYLNGVALTNNVTQNALTGTILASNDYVIGVDYQLAEFMDGKIDEVRIWSTNRSTMDIQDNIYTRFQGNEAGLVGYYTFDEDNGSNVVDMSGNGNDGLINGPQFEESEFTQPTDFYVVRVDDQNVQLNWTDNWIEAGTTIYTSTDFDGADATALISLPSDQTTYTHNLGVDTSFFYLLEPFNGDEIVQSNPEFGTTYAFPGFAMDFDGTGDFVQADERDTAFYDLTVSAWVYPTSFAADAWIYWRGNQSVNTGAELYINTSGQLVYGESDGTYEAATSTASLPLNQWTFVSATKSGTTVQLYIDGVADGTNASVTGTPEIGQITIGARNRMSGADGYFQGLIDEVRVWSMVKTVFTDRFGALNGNETDLQYYYTFDENTNGAAFKQVVDRSIHTADGTLFGDPQWTGSEAGLPEAPVNLSVFVNSSIQPQLDWDDVSGALSYVVERSENDNTNYSQVGTPTSSDFNDATASNDGSIYFYRVRAFDGNNNSLPSNEVFADIKGPGNALAFNGVDEFVSTTTTALNTGATFSAWINTTSTDNSDPYAGNPALAIVGDFANSVYQTFGITDGYVDYHYNTNPSWEQVLGSIKVNDGNWHHVAVTHDQSTGDVVLYVDGGVDVIGNIAYTAVTPGFNRIGGSYVDGTNTGAFFDGSLDDVKIFNSSLNQSDLRQEMYATDIARTSLLAYYDFDQAEGLNLPDLKSAIDGTLAGGFIGDNSDWVESAAYKPFIYQITDANPNSFAANWLQVETASGYQIDYGTDPSFSTFNTEVLGHNDSTATISTSLIAGTEYYARLRFEDGGFVSDTSATVSFFTTPGYALDFDGTDDYIRVDHPYTDFVDEITVELWINFDGLAGNFYALGQSSADVDNMSTNVFVVGAGDVSFPTFWVNNNGSWINTTYNPGAITGWHHLAGVGSPSGVQLYFDGEPVGTPGAGLTGIQSNGSAVLDIGKDSRFTTASLRVSGETMDEIRIWNFARSQEEIKEDLYSTLSGAEAGLVGYYRLDQTTGTSVPDLSTRQAEGTWNGAGSGAYVAPNWQQSTAFSTENFIVTNTNDTGAGSLRQAIIDANNSASDIVEITFDIPNTGPWIIAPGSELETITKEGLIIDAETQPDWDLASENMVTIDATGFTGEGLEVAAPNVGIYGLRIMNARYGVQVTGDTNDGLVVGSPEAGNVFLANDHDINIVDADDVTIQGNNLGVSGDGITTNAGNASIVLSGSASNIQIGGLLSANEGNLMAGSNTTSLGYLINAGAQDMINVQGNRIGVGINNSDITTSRGLYFNGSTNVTIGGSSPDYRNYIGGINSTAGIQIVGGSSIEIRNNYIGVADDGVTALANVGAGILLESDAQVTIAENLISGNTTASGILTNGISTSAIIDANIIGLQASGSAGLGNATGITVQGSSNVSITNNFISDNSNDGIHVTSTSSGNTIQGNLVGTDITGNAGLGNGGYGIRFSSNSTNNTVGGSSVGQENVISANSNDGIYITGTSTGNMFYGNVIGKTSDLSGDLANAGNYGIHVNAGSNTIIGGDNAGEGNYIANTSSAGVFIFNATVGVQVIGNTFENTIDPIDFSNTGSPNNDQEHPIITEVESGMVYGRFETPATAGDIVHLYTTTFSNIDQAETYLGSFVASGGETTWSIGGSFDITQGHQTTLTNPINGTSEFTVHSVVRNVSDTGAGSLRDAMTALNSTQNGGGISFNLPGPGYVISPTTELPLITTHLVIDATTDAYYNFAPGIVGDLITLDGSGCTSCDGFYSNNANATLEIYGFRIRNFTHGIQSIGISAPAHIIGAPGRGNVVVSNTGTGIYLDGANNSGITVQGNLVGLEFDNTLAGNNRGMQLQSQGMQVGGKLATERNVISGNTQDGIFFNGAGSSIIENNYIGTTIDGLSSQDPMTNSLGNGSEGMFFGNGDSNIRIDSNVVASSGSHALHFQVNNDNNIIINNFIGVAADGTTDLGNLGNGVFFDGQLSSDDTGNQITDNIIAHNGQVAVQIDRTTSSGNIIRRNQIFDNTLGGIVGGNAGIAAPSVTIDDNTTVSGTAGANDIVDLFLADALGQGQAILDSATADGLGDWSITGLNLQPGDDLVATATSATDGTSTFSSIQSIPLRNSLNFDGFDDYVEVADDPLLALDGDYGFGAWFYLESLPDDEFKFLVSKRDATDFLNPIAVGLSTRAAESGTSGMPALYAFIGDGSTGLTLVTSGAQDLIGSWHHVFFTVEGTQMRLYLDGVEVDNATYSGTRPTNSHRLELGAETGYPSSFLDGFIDDVQLWNEAKNLSSVQALMDSTLAGSEPNLLAYYDFEVCNGTLLPDLSGNNLAGTLASFDFSAGSDWDHPNPNIGVSPSTQVTSIAVSNILEDQFTIDWTPGDGEKSIVFVKQTAVAENEGATNNTTYLAATDFGAGTQLPPNFHAVYNGYGSNVTVTGLTELTDYRILIYSYNDCAGSEQYNNSTAEGVNVTNVQTPQLENALDFDGTDFVTTVASVGEGQSSLTVEAWVYPTAYPSGDTFTRSIVTDGDYGGGIGTYAMVLTNISSTDYFAVSLRTDGPSEETALIDAAMVPLSTWTHVAFSWNDGEAIRTFINGTEVANSSGVLTGSTASSVEDLVIGSNVNGAEENFIGQIDEVRIWNIAKDQQAVRDDLFTEFTGPTTNLLASYSFNTGLPAGDNTGITTVAEVALGGDGDISSFDRTGSTSNFVVSTAFTSGAPIAVVTGNDLEVDAGNTPRVADGTQLIGFSSPVLQTFRITNNGTGDLLLDTSTPVVMGGTGFSLLSPPSQTTIAPFQFEDFIISYDPTSGSNSGTMTILDDIPNPITSITLDGVGYPEEPGSGYALSFDGTNDEVIVPDTSTLQFGQGDFTAEAWFYFDGTPNVNTILSKRDPSGNVSAWIVAISDGNPYTPSAGSKIGAAILPDGRTGTANDRVVASVADVTPGWHHAAMVQTYASGMSLYLDGVLVGTDNTSHGVLDVNIAQDLHIGSNNTPDYFTGQIDEVRIWNEARSEADLRANLAQKLDVISFPASLVSYYRFDENTGDGTTLFDLVGGNHGAITGATPQLSGARFGDESNFTTTTSFALSGAVSGNNLTVNNILGSPDIVFGYRVNEAPNDTSVPPSFASFNSTDYYGVFTVGGTNPTFNTQFGYAGNPDASTNEDEFRIVRRDDNAAGAFSRVSTFFDLFTPTDQLTVADQISGEFAQGVAIQLPAEVFPGQALTFDGAGDGIDVADDVLLDNLANVTIEAWINPASNPTTFHTFIDKYEGPNRQFVFGMDANGALHVETSWNGAANGVRSANGEVTLNEWHHYAATIEPGTGITLYKDGQLLGNTTFGDPTVALVANNANLTIGYTPSLGYDLDGSLDEIRIWDAVLTQPTIDTYHSIDLDGSHPNLSGLIARYKLDEGLAGADNTGITGPGEIQDYAENGLLGTMIGFAKNGATSNWVASEAAQPEINVKDAVGPIAVSSTLDLGVEFVGQTHNETLTIENTGSTDLDLTGAPLVTSSNADFVTDLGLTSTPISGASQTTFDLNVTPSVAGLQSTTINIPNTDADEDPYSFTVEIFGYPDESGAGQALALDGGTDYLSTSSASLVTGNADHTFEAWVKIDNAQTGDRWIAWWGDAGGNSTVAIGYDASNSNQIRVHHLSTGNDILTSTVLPMGSWNHVALTYNGTGQSSRLFLNGVFQEEINFTFPLNLPASSTLELGTLFGSTGASFIIDGELDEVRFWNGIISDAEITNHWLTNNLSSHPNAGDLISYYRFDENTGITLYDLNGPNNLDFFGTPTWVSSMALMDTHAPSVTITSTESSPTTVNPIPITVTFSEVVSGFVDSDIETNGVVSAFSTSDNTVFTFDLNVSKDTIYEVNIPAGVAQDASSNNNTASTPFAITYDVSFPQPVISSGSSDPTGDNPISISIDFGEVVTGFVSGDITPGNGAISNFVDVDGQVYTADFTPTSDGTITVDVSGGVADDAVSNSNLPATQFSLTYDGTGPQGVITSGSTDPTADNPIAVTIDFGETVTGFTEGDLTVGNGNTSNFVDVDGQQYMVDVTPTADGTVTIDIAGSLAQDISGNDNIASTQYSITYDGSVPTPIISSTSIDPTNDNPIAVSIDFGEDVTGFVEGDLTVGNGTTSNFVAVDGQNYTVDIIPSGDGTVTVDIAGAVAQDGSSNDNLAAVQYSIRYDGSSPQGVISSTSTDPTNDNPISVSVDFGEGVVNFTDADVTVSNGSVSNFVNVDHQEYTFDLTPTADGLVTVDIMGSVLEDSAGNSNIASTQYSITYDGTSPIGVISTSESDPTSASPFTVSIDFGEDVSGFGLADLTVGNGVASNLVAVDGQNYTADITPSGDGSVTVDIGGGLVSDASGNGNTASSQFSIVFDGSSPQGVITSTSTDPTNADPIGIMIDFGELVTGFEDTDIVVSNGTLGNFVDVDGQQYTADITPSGDGEITVDISGGVTQDSQGNANIASTQYSITYDGTSPTGVITSSSTDPTNSNPISVSVDFGELVTGFEDTDLTLDNGSVSNFVDVDGQQYTFDLTPLSEDTVRVDIAAGLATDASGNQNLVSLQYKLLYDATAPNVEIDTLLTLDSTPGLSGTVDDTLATVVVTVDGVDYTATVSGDSTWAISDNTVAALSDGLYELSASATDAAGNVGVDSSGEELTVDTSAPVVTFDDLITEELSPGLSGTVDDVGAEVSVTVSDSTYSAVNNGDGTWSITSTESLLVGLYSVEVKGIDAAGNEGVGSGSLTIDAGAPTALSAVSVGSTGFTAVWNVQSGGVTEYQLDVSSSTSFTDFVSGYANLSTSDTSAVVTGLDYNVRYYYRVRALYGSGDLSGNSNTIEVRTIVDTGTELDSLALVGLYNSTGGSGWTQSTNWLSGRLGDWAGVTMEGTRVTGLLLPDNNMLGDLGDITSGLDQLSSLDLSGNGLTGIGDVSGLSGLESADVSGNDLEFGDLERLLLQTSNLSYLDQGEALEEGDVLLELGESFTVDRTVSGSGNVYEWFRDGESISNTGGTLEVTITGPEDEGVYTVLVTNGSFAGLTLGTKAFSVKVSSLERDQAALLNIYEALEGSSWSNGADWPNNGDITTWIGVTVTNNRVVGLDLSSSNVVGDMPDDLQDIGTLVDLDLSDNGLTRLPDLSGQESWSSLNVSGNNLDFGDLEPNAEISVLTYTNQGIIGEEEVEILVSQGSDYRLVFETGGSQNSYTWSRLNAFGSREVGDGSNAVTINGIRYENMGVFSAEISNVLLPLLTLETHPIKVFATARLDGTVLGSDGSGLSSGTVQALRIPFAGESSVGYDSLDAITVTNGAFTFGDLVLGDLLLSTRGDETIYLPTYLGNTDLFIEADTVFLRSDFSIGNYRMQTLPEELPPLPDGGEVGMLVESDFAEERSRAEEAGRLFARRKLQKVGCSLRRRRRATGGRPEQEDEFELVVYKETDADGRVTFENLPPDTYRLNIEYPGIPMDPDSFVEFEVGEGGLENNTLELEATVGEDGIAVELIEELGFYRHYFKDLELYPNPVDEELTISYSKLLSKEVRVQLLSLQGRLIREERVGHGYNRRMVLDTRDVENGIYLVRFIDPTRKEGKNIVTYKIIVRRR